MFTGIITHTGTIKVKTASTLAVAAPTTLLKALKIGDSISVSGVCLTVVKKTKDAFWADIMPETLKRSMFGKLKLGSVVNLELPLRAGDFLSGHVVQGHVDGTARIVSIIKKGNSRIVTLETGSATVSAIANKGSVAINGISLTVIHIKDARFSVGIIPHTWDVTSFAAAKAGDLVNIETDHSGSVIPAEAGIQKIAIVSSTFHKDITAALKKNCIATLKKHGVKNITIVDVPGALEIPVVAKKLAKQGTYGAIIALGAVHKGQTYHFEQVSNECARGCMQVACDFEIPVIYEVLSVYDLKDARERVDRGAYAAETALTMMQALNSIH